MSVNTLLYGLFFSCNCAILSATILTPIKDEGPLRLYNLPQNGYEFTVKRSQDDCKKQYSTEPQNSRRFIRSGRNRFDGNVENFDYSLSKAEEKKAKRAANNPKLNIRFGRSGLKTLHNTDNMYERVAREDLSMLRFGRNADFPSVADLSVVCPNMLMEEDLRNNKDLRMYLSKLMYVCNNNGLSRSDDSLHRNNVEITDDDDDSV